MAISPAPLDSHDRLRKYSEVRSTQGLGKRGGRQHSEEPAEAAAIWAPRMMWEMTIRHDPRADAQAS